MTTCPACRGTGRRPLDGRHLALVVGAKKPLPPCGACAGTGKLVDVLLRSTS